MLVAGPAHSRKERGWGKSLATALSAASGDLAVRRTGLLPAQVALSIVQSVEERSFGRFRKGKCLGSGQETCVMGTRVQGHCSLWTLAAPALGRVIHEASAPVQKEHRDTRGNWSPAAGSRGAQYPEDA